jgi:hypothetical protein
MPFEDSRLKTECSAPPETGQSEPHLPDMKPGGVQITSLPAHDRTLSKVPRRQPSSSQRESWKPSEHVRKQGVMRPDGLLPSGPSSMHNAPSGGKPHLRNADDSSKCAAPYCATWVLREGEKYSILQSLDYGSLMTIFDLLFIAVLFASLATVLTAAASAIRGRGAHALRILRVYGICAAVYLAMVALTSVLLPRRVLKVGDLRCSDDWCIAVENVIRTPAHATVFYRVTLRLSSRARRVPQRENGVVVYLTDSRGQRYDPKPDPTAVPFNVTLQPQQSIAAARVFEVPADARDVGLVIRLESGFPIGWFIVGYETWFRKPAIVRLPS